jgi:hypothetical protein
LFAAFLVATCAFHSIEANNDFFWHLRTGLDFIGSGLSPYVDHYSYSFTAHAISSPAWIFDSILASFYRFAGGFLGVQIFLFACFASSLFVLLQISGKKGVSLHAQVLGLCWAYFALHTRSEPRPDALAFLFIAASLALFFESQNSKSWRPLIWFAVLQLVWTNVHTSSVLGYVIAAGIYLNFGLRMSSSKELNRQNILRLLAMGSLTIAAGFLNPDGQFALLIPRHDWALYISEYLPISFADSPRIVFEAVAFGLFGLFACIKQRNWGGVLLLTVLMWQALQMQRLLPILVFVSVPFAIIGVEQIFKVIQSQSKRRMFLGLYALPVFVFIADPLLVMLPELYLNPAAYVADFDHSVQPTEVTDFMKSKGLKGRIRNELGNGGYLIFALAPESSVFIDGRTNILYPFEFVQSSFAATSDSNLLKEEVLKYRSDYVVARSGRSGYLLDAGLESGLFGFEYSGKYYALLSRAPGKYPTVSKVYVHPECLTERMLPDLQRELELAKVELPTSSPLLAFLATTVSYLEAGDHPALHKMEREWQSPHWLRLMATLAIKKNEPKLALGYYLRLEENRRADRLAMAKIACDHFQCVGVEDILNVFPGAGIQDFEWAEMLQLLERSQAIQPTKFFDRNRMSYIRSRLAKYPPGQLPTALNLCH